MGWEHRRGCTNLYYTRSRREGRTVRREYVGCGPLAEEAAALDEAQRERRRREREVQNKERAQAQSASRSLAALAALTDAVMCQQLAEAGFHTHHGEWRRRRRR
jgi:hypothetical protein